MDLNLVSSIPPLSGEIFNSLPEPIRVYIRFLEASVQQLKVTVVHLTNHVNELQTRVRDLEARLSKNSSNSSKPPSSDGLKRKPKSERKKSGKKPGGQQGRVGKGLTQVDNPDVIVTHAPTECQGCGSSLKQVNGFCAEKRQVFEIPQPKVEVTEHRVLEKVCACCGTASRAVFPDNVRGPVQYGNLAQALTAYFANHHFIPVNRVCEILEDIFCISISPGTCANIDEKLFTQLEPFEINLKINLVASEVLHFDETGMRCEKKLHWVHVASSQLATLYTMHAKRGQEAMDEANILPQFKGTAIHDHWFPYFAYEQVVHGLCNAHHLRELTFVYEQEKEDWAKSMKELLIFANNEVEKYLIQGALPEKILTQIKESYTQIVNAGLAYHALLPPLPTGKRGRQKQRDGKNLLDRLVGKRDCILRFMNDFSVPFTNNQGEQDIRMVKLKQKVSGCFRTPRGGQIFCRIRSYISTARKQGWKIWDAIAEAIEGRPRLLELPELAPSQAIAV